MKNEATVRGIRIAAKAVLALFVSFVILFSSSPSLLAAERPVIRVTTINKISYLFLSDVARYYQLRMVQRGNDVWLIGAKRKIHFTLHHRNMELDGTQYYLSRPLADLHGVRFLAKEDFLGLLDPLMKPAKLPRRKIRKILLDPGHGGKDTGAIVSNVNEKQINLSTALAVMRALRKAGFVVYLTRGNDKELTLDQRTKMSANLKPDLFISLHCNTAQSKVKGVETYLATRKGCCPATSSVVTTTSCEANRYDVQNLMLASLVHQKILQTTKQEDRGVRPMRYYVIRKVSCPSILVEMGFMTDADELKTLRTSAHQQKVANAIVAALRKYQEYCQ